MDSKGTDSLRVTPEEARHILDDVSAIRQSVQGKPNLWAVTLFAVLFAALATTGIWEELTAMLVLLPLAVIVLVVFRRQLFSPYTRERPVVDFDEEKGTRRTWWRDAVWPLWIMVGDLGSGGATVARPHRRHPGRPARPLRAPNSLTHDNPWACHGYPSLIHDVSCRKIRAFGKFPRCHA